MKLSVESEVAMKALGEKIGQRLKGGEVVELIGDVGAGKTTFAKGLGRGLGVDEDIQSPSFTISRVYDGRDDVRLAHYDFYRLHDAGIMLHDLKESTDDPKTVTIIEWGDVVKEVLPAEYLELRFVSPSDSEREITIHTHGNRYEQIIGDLT